MNANFYREIRPVPILIADQIEASNLIYRLRTSQHDGIACTIRGHKCKTYDALHNEIAAALQFPGYYGENWAALDECITDLEWLPGNWYLLHIVNIENVLEAASRDFTTFIHLLLNTATTWANPRLRILDNIEVEKPTPFNVLVSGSHNGLNRVNMVLKNYELRRVYRSTK